MVNELPRTLVGPRCVKLVKNVNVESLLFCSKQLFPECMQQLVRKWNMS